MVWTCEEADRRDREGGRGREPPAVPPRPTHVADAELAQHHAVPHLLRTPLGRHGRRQREAVRGGASRHVTGLHPPTRGLPARGELDAGPPPPAGPGSLQQCIPPAPPPPVPLRYLVVPPRRCALPRPAPHTIWRRRPPSLTGPRESGGRGSLTANVTSGCSAAGERQQPARRGPGRAGQHVRAGGGGRRRQERHRRRLGRLRGQHAGGAGPGRGWRRRRRGGTEPSGR